MKAGKTQAGYQIRGPRWLWDYVPLVLWMALIFWLSSRPRLVDIEGEYNEVFFFKGAHLVAYAVLLWLWWRALSPARWVTRLRMAAAFGMTVLYGLSDEFHQLYVPGRHGRLSDVMVDALGALLMVALLSGSKRLRLFPENMWRVGATDPVQVSRSR